MPPGARIGFVVRTRLPRRTPFDPGGPHQPGNLITAHVVAVPACGFPQLVRPVAAVVVLSQLDQGRAQDGVTARPRRRRPRLGRVVRTRGHLHTRRRQRGADGLDPELAAVVVDEVDYFLCWRSSSAPKKLPLASESRWRA